jgi:hypothetical protein
MIISILKQESVAPRYVAPFRRTGNKFDRDVADVNPYFLHFLLFILFIITLGQQNLWVNSSGSGSLPNV